MERRGVWGSSDGGLGCCLRFDAKAVLFFDLEENENCFVEVVGDLYNLKIEIKKRKRLSLSFL